MQIITVASCKELEDQTAQIPAFGGIKETKPVPQKSRSVSVVVQ